MELTLLSCKDIWIDTPTGSLSDYAYLTGATNNPFLMAYWLKSISKDNYAYTVNLWHGVNHVLESKGNYSHLGILPVLDLSPQEMKQYVGLKEVTLGEYPQSIASDNANKYLNFNQRNLEKTGKQYTIVVRSKDTFTLQKVDEYELFGKCVPMKAPEGYYNGLKGGEQVWVEVEPIKWQVDEPNRRLIAASMLLGGVPFDTETNPTTYQDSYLKKYMDSYMYEEMELPEVKTTILSQDDMLQDYFLSTKKKQLIKGKKG